MFVWVVQGFKLDFHFAENTWFSNKVVRWGGWGVKGEEMKKKEWRSKGVDLIVVSEVFKGAHTSFKYIIAPFSVCS